MQMKQICFLIIFQIMVFSIWGQSRSDLSMKASAATQEATVDAKEQERIKAEQEKAKQDSIKQIIDKWTHFLLGKNKEIAEIYSSVLQIDSNTVTKEIIEEYKIDIQSLKRSVEHKLSSEPIWQDHNKLDDLHASFFKTHDRTSSLLLQWEEKLAQKLARELAQKKDPPNKLVIIGICLLAVMAIVPVITQIRSGMMMRKIKKQQEQEAKKLQEEAERQMLLADDNNVITLKE